MGCWRRKWPILTPKIFIFGTKSQFFGTEILSTGLITNTPGTTTFPLDPPWKNYRFWGMGPFLGLFTSSGSGSKYSYFLFDIYEIRIIFRFRKIINGDRRLLGSCKTWLIKGCFSEKNGQNFYWNCQKLVVPWCLPKIGPDRRIFAKPSDFLPWHPIFVNRAFVSLLCVTTITHWTLHNISFCFWVKAIWAEKSVFSFENLNPAPLHCGTLPLVNSLCMLRAWVLRALALRVRAVW